MSSDSIEHDRVRAWYRGCGERERGQGFGQNSGNAECSNVLSQAHGSYLSDT